MKTGHSRQLATAALAVVILSFGGGQAARATVLLGGSAGDGATASLTFTPVIGPKLTATAGPFPSAAGLAPAPYSVTATGVAFPLPFLTVSGFIDDAASDVDGLPGVRFADADSTINNLSVGPIFSLLPPILALTLTSVSTFANVTGDFPTLVPTGGTTFTGGILTIPYLGIGPITLSGSPAANTQVGAPGLGVSVLLNEQILTGNGSTFQRIEVNGIHIAFALPVFAPPVLLLPPVFLGTLSGDLILSRSIATLVAGPPGTPPPPPGFLVPEPSTFALAGAAGLILMARRIKTAPRPCAGVS